MQASYSVSNKSCHWVLCAEKSACGCLAPAGNLTALARCSHRPVGLAHHNSLQLCAPDGVQVTSCKVMCDDAAHVAHLKLLQITTSINVQQIACPARTAIAGVHIPLFAPAALPTKITHQRAIRVKCCSGYGTLGEDSGVALGMSSWLLKLTAAMAAQRSRSRCVRSPRCGRCGGHSQ